MKSEVAYVCMDIVAAIEQQGAGRHSDIIDFL